MQFRGCALRDSWYNTLTLISYTSLLQPSDVMCVYPVDHVTHARVSRLLLRFLYQMLSERINRHRRNMNWSHNLPSAESDLPGPVCREMLVCAACKESHGAARRLNRPHMIVDASSSSIYSDQAFEKKIFGLLPIVSR